MADENENDGITVDLTTDNYDGWSWKEIEVALVGGIDMSATAQSDKLAGTSVPITLVNAASTFLDAQNKLVTVQTGLDNLKKAVEKTWKGKGSDAFNTLLTNFQTSLSTVVESLTGTKGTPSYFSTLLASGISLEKAVWDVLAIDHWGAQSTVDRWNSRVHFNDEVEPWHTEGGTTIVHVSHYPDIVTEMTSKMRTVINSLAQSYRGYKEDLRDPGDVKFDTGTNNNNGNVNIKMPKIKMPEFKQQKSPHNNTDSPNLNNSGLNGPVGAPPPGLNGDAKNKDPNANGLNDPNKLNGLNDPNKLNGLNGGVNGLTNADPYTRNKLNGLTNAGQNGLNGLTNAGQNGLNGPRNAGQNGLNGLRNAGRNGLTGPGGLRDPNKLPNLNLQGPPNLKISPPKTPPLGNLFLRNPGSFKLPPGLGLPNLTNRSGGAFTSPDLRRSGLGGLGSRLGGLNAPDKFSTLRSGTGTTPAALAAAAAARKALQAEQNMLGAAGRGAAGLNGMPYMPPMGAGAGRGKKDDERERNTWLQEEEEDVWGTTPQVGPAFLDGSTATG